MGSRRERVLQYFQKLELPYTLSLCTTAPLISCTPLFLLPPAFVLYVHNVPRRFACFGCEGEVSSTVAESSPHFMGWYKDFKESFWPDAKDTEQVGACPT